MFTWTQVWTDKISGTRTAKAMEQWFLSKIHVFTISVFKIISLMACLSMLETKGISLIRKTSWNS